MAKRGATEQITKDTYVDTFDPDDREPGGRDRSEEPMTVASTEVLSKRKILKPRSRTGGTPARTPVTSSNLFQPTTSATPGPGPKPSLGSLFGGGNQPSTPSMFGAQPVAQTEPPKPNPFAAAAKTSSSLFSFGGSDDSKKSNPFAALASSTQSANPFSLSTTKAAPAPIARPTTPPPASNSPFMFGSNAPTTPKPASSGFGGFGSNVPSTPKPTTPASKTTSAMFGNGFGSTTPQAAPPSNFFGNTSSIQAPESTFGASTAPPAKALFGSAATTSTTPMTTPMKNPFGGSTTTIAPSFGANSGSMFGKSTTTIDSTPKAAEGFSPAPSSMFQFGAKKEEIKEEQPDKDVTYPNLFTAPKLPVATSNYDDPAKPSRFASTGLDNLSAFSNFTPSGFGGVPKAKTDTGNAKPIFSLGPPKTNGTTSQQTSKTHDIQSLTPPPDSELSTKEMPDYNYLVQVRSLNEEFFKELQTARSEDPLGDWTKWAEFYTTQMSSFSKLRENQKDKTENGMSIDHGNEPTKLPVDRSMTDAPIQASPASNASKMFESFLGSQADTTKKDVAYPDLSEPKQSGFAAQNPSTTPAFNVFNNNLSSATSNMFAQKSTQENNDVAQKTTATAFGAAANGNSSSMFASRTATTSVPTSSIFNFGSQSTSTTTATKANDSSNMFGGAKPLSSIFNLGPPSANATPSNASSPGSSVLAGGSAGMTNANDGGWQNPFAKIEKNSMFITDTSDKSDDDAGGDEEDGDGEHAGEDDKHEEVPTDVDTSPDLSQLPQNKATGSLFGSTTSTTTPFQFSSTNTTSTAPINFGSATTPKTGSVGLFGTTSTPKEKDHTWTPDKPITFAPKPSETKPIAPGGLFGAAANSGTSTPIFSLTSAQANTAPQAPIFGSLFGSTPAADSATTQSTSTSIFSNNNNNNSLAPPSIFSGFKSPIPSGPSTPGTDFGGSDTPGASSGGNGDDNNDPSDEAGQGASSNTTDLSGPGPGEEDEDTKFDVRSAIYQNSKSAPQLVKTGVGRARVLKNRENGKARIVVKVETGKLLMNVALRKDVDYNAGGTTGPEGKTVKILEVLPAGQGSRVWVMKVGKVEDAMALRKTIEENK